MKLDPEAVADAHVQGQRPQSVFAQEPWVSWIRVWYRRHEAGENLSFRWMYQQLLVGCEAEGLEPPAGRTSALQNFCRTWGKWLLEGDG